MIVVGIDPGSKGGLSWISPKGISSIPIPYKEVRNARHKVLDVSRLDKWIQECISKFGKPDSVVMEDVHAMPRDSRKAAFTFGWNSGSIASYFLSLGHEIEYIAPKDWQGKILSPLLSSYKSGKQHSDLTRKELLKLASREYVKGKYPSLSLIPSPRSKNEHDGMSDSVCLAEYKRLSVGTV